MEDELDNFGDAEYTSFNELDFRIITMGMKRLPFFEDDPYLGMQAMNVGIADSVITKHEYELLYEYHEIEKTPFESAMAVSALSQMWVYGLYEVLRMWRERRFQFQKLLQSGGIDSKIESMPDDDPLNLTVEVRKRQLLRFKNNQEHREQIDATWTKIEPAFRMAELFRMNLAKHCAPGKNGVLPKAPGYGRINSFCGSMDFELIETDGCYTISNRRDIADALRTCLKEV